MNDVKELLRTASPAPLPQSLAFDGEHLWMGSRETHRLYAIDPNQWRVTEEATAPGRPFGMVAIGDEFRIVIGDDENDRYLHRFIPGHGFKESERIACPDHTGSFLSYDGDTLFLGQAHNKRLLALDEAGAVVRTIQLDRKTRGQVVVDGCFYVLTGDDEFENMEFARVDARGEVPVVTQLGRVPFGAIGLTYDGARFWTCDRDKNEIVSFERPA